MSQQAREPASNRPVAKFFVVPAAAGCTETHSGMVLGSFGYIGMSSMVWIACHDGLSWVLADQNARNRLLDGFRALKPHPQWLVLESPRMSFGTKTRDVAKQ